MKKTIEESKLPKEFYAKYLQETDYPFLINSFNYLNWPDPFPEECKKEPKEFAYLVYHEWRYTPEYSPLCNYIPTKEVMLKLMRACVAVSDEKQFWFNNEK